MHDKMVLGEPNYRIFSNWTRILIEPSFQYNPNFCFLNLNYNPHSNITRNIFPKENVFPLDQNGRYSLASFFN